MAKSSGARPKKAQRAELLALKAELNKCKSSEWIRAQSIFDRMVNLCKSRGPSGMVMQPRSCRSCGYFGHTSQHCPKIKALWEEAAAHPERLVWPEELKESDCTPEQWQSIKRMEAMDALYDQCVAEGMGCSAGDGKGACMKCQDCEAWRARFTELSVGQ